MIESITPVNIGPVNKPIAEIIGEAMSASIERQINGEAVSTLRDFTPAVLEAGNRRVEQAFPDNMRKILILGADALMLSQGTVVQFDKPNLGPFLETLLVERRLLSAQERERNRLPLLFPEAPTPTFRKNMAAVCRNWAEERLLDDQGQPLITFRSDIDAYGFNDVVVKDIRQTRTYAKLLFSGKFDSSDAEVQERLMTLRDRLAARIEMTADDVLNTTQLERSQNIYKQEHAKDDDIREGAACRDPAVKRYFFPPGHFERKSDKLARIARAAEICGSCSINSACYDYAESRGERFGVWGGVNFEISYRERQRIRKKQKESQVEQEQTLDTPEIPAD